jgi:D-alanine-D-alanine ligase
MSPLTTMRIGITFDLKTASPSDDDSQEEFDSPATIDAIAAVIRGLGHDVVLLGDGRDMLEALRADPPEFVFNFAEGHGISRTREARVPAVLEMLGIPYSGSDPLTLAATLDKDCAKRLVASAGVATPRARLVTPDERAWKVDFPADFPFPAIVKPNWEGSSKGIRHRCLVKSPEELAQTVEWLRGDQRQPVLIEEYVEGDELTVGILGNELAAHAESAAGLHVLGIMRVLPQFATDCFVYTLEVKRDFRRLVRYECPAQLPAKHLAAVERAARTVWRTLGCRDVSRIDFRLRDGVPYFLEVNPLPGLHPDDSDLVIMAKLVGWSYERLVETILNAARARTRNLAPPIGRRDARLAVSREL